MRSEVLELTAHGAKVLHPGCVEIARRTGVALYARATALMGGGTRVDLVGAGADVDAVGVTGQKRLVRVRAEGEQCVDRVLAAAAEARVPALHLDTDMESADLWFALAAFFAFRVLDTVKPYPVSTLQDLHGAAGIMLDDIVAPGYTMLIPT